MTESHHGAKSPAPIAIGDILRTNNPSFILGEGKAGASPPPDQHSKSASGLEQPSSGEQLLLSALEVCFLLGEVKERSLARLEKLGFISRVPKRWPKVYRYEDVLKMVEALSKSKGGSHE